MESVESAEMPGKMSGQTKQEVNMLLELSFADIWLEK